MGETEHLSEEAADQLVRACRTAVGDSLRSVVYFTPESEQFLYLRSDLEERGERSREVKRQFVENERMGFTSQETYDRLTEEGDARLDIGDYEFTVRVFTEGFISRVIVGEHGVLLTADEMHVDEFEELAVTLRKLLAELE